MTAEEERKQLEKYEEERRLAMLRKSAEQPVEQAENFSQVTANVYKEKAPPKLSSNLSLIHNKNSQRVPSRDLSFGSSPVNMNQALVPGNKRINSLPPAVDGLNSSHLREITPLVEYNDNDAIPATSQPNMKILTEEESVSLTGSKEELR